MIIKIKKSNQFTAISLVAHAGALFVSLILPIVGWQQFGLALLIGASWWWQERYGAWARTGEIKLGEDDSCILIMNNGQQRYKIAQASIHPGFVRLNLRGIGRRSCTQLVPRDSVDSETYRILRTWIVQRRFAVAGDLNAR